LIEEKNPTNNLFFSLRLAFIL